MSIPPRIIFFGTPEFAAFTLRDLEKRGVNIVTAVTTPDRLQGRGMKLRESAVKEAAMECGIPVLMPENLHEPALLGVLRSLNADVFVVVAYKILPKEIFEIPRIGAFNIHASLLPKYRGAAPINWAIMNGEKQTGITTFLLAEKIDTGNILIAKPIQIGMNETAGELHDRLMHLGADVAFDTLTGLADGTLRPVIQPTEGASRAPKLFPKDCEVDFRKSSEDIHNFIRGLSPHPASTVMVNGTRIKLLRSRLPPDGPQNLQPGTWGVAPGTARLFVGTLDNAIEILELQREGKRAMKSEEFLRGNASLFYST